MKWKNLFLANIILLGYWNLFLAELGIIYSNPCLIPRYKFSIYVLNKWSNILLPSEMYQVDLCFRH